MKVKELLRQPNVQWVNRDPNWLSKHKEPPSTGQIEHCLVTAINFCYPTLEENKLLIYRIGGFSHIWQLADWQDQQTLETVLQLVDRMDI